MGRIVVIDVKSLHDGTGRVFRPGRVVIAADRIVAVGCPHDRATAAASCGVPAGEADGVTYINCPQSTALPGLIDTHVHLTLGTGLRTYEQVMTEDSDEVMLQRALENARTHLRSGVTTMRDLGARGGVGFAVRDAASRRAAANPMPALLVCGRPVTAPRGHFWFCGEEAEGPEGMRESVRRLVGEGADVIKVMVTGGGSAGTDRRRAYLDVEELAAVVDEAQCHGLPVVVHAQGTPGIRNAVAAKVDVIEHCDFLDPAGQPQFDPYVAEQISEAGIYVDPTLHVLRISVEMLTELGTARPLTGEERGRLDSFRARYEAGRANVGRFRQLGVKLVGGTDAIRRFGDYYLTFETLRECGLPAGEALAAMTSVAAHSMGIADRAGRLVPGMLADVLIVDGDPAADDQALRRVRQVYRSGEAVL